MAVENKFKINVIAASVLMGLSLSAVAAGGTDNAGKTEKGAVTAEKEATPAKAKSLAEVAGTAKPEDISVTVGTSGSMKLDAALKAVDGAGGKPAEDASAKKGYVDAVAAYGKLKPEDVQKITDLSSKKSAFDTASAGFDAFDVKSKAVNDIYNSKLKNLYGSAGDVAGHAWTITEGDAAGGTGATIALNKSVPDSVFTDVISSIEKTKNAVVALEAQAIKSAGDAAASDAAKKADAAVKAYAAYLDKSYKVIQEQQKQAAAENYIQEKLPDFLTLVERYKKADGNTASDKTENASKLDGKYDAYIKAVKDYRDAKESDKPDKKTVVYTALNSLVTTAGTATISDADKAKVSEFTKSLEAAHTIWDTAAGQLGATGNLQSGLDAAKDLKTLKDNLPEGIDLTITNNETAFAGIDKYLKVLIAEAETKGADKEQLTAAIATAKEANKVFTEKQDKYTAALAELNAAGSERLALVPEWKTLNDAWTEAADALNAAETAYKGSGAETAAKALKDKKDAYVKALGDTSAGIQTAIGSAASTYAAAVKEGGTAKTQQEKNAALYALTGQKKALVPAKLQMDKELLELKSEDVAGLQNQLSLAEKNKADAEKSYNEAVKEYLAAKEVFGKTNAVADEVAVSVAEQKLFTLTGKNNLQDLYVANDPVKGPKSGFKQFKEFASSPAETSWKTAKTTLYNNADIQNARKAVAEGLNHLASLMPLSTAEEQKAFRADYNSALKTVSMAATTAEAQSKVANAEGITHYLGGLSASEITQYDPASGSYKSVIVNVDKDGNVTGVKDNFTGKDLYTGSQDKPFTTTVLNIEAPELGNGALADTNSITVGEASVKGKKASPVEVWAKTAGAKWSDDASAFDKSGNGPAVKLSGELRTTTAQLDENGAPVKDTVVRGADQIVLQNVNIHNSFTLADKVRMMADDVAALNREAADRTALGQPAESDKNADITGVKDWLKEQNGLLSGKYDALILTGLDIDTTTVSPVFDLNTGAWKMPSVTTAPKDANILLDNLNITLQNDSVGGVSTAIDLSGAGNHILANGGVFDAGHVTGTHSEANVLDISGKNNIVDFSGSVLKGDIVSGDAGNVVNLTRGGNLTGDVSALNHKYLSLNLDGSTWTGGAGPNSPDVSLSNNSVWDVKGYHGGSVNATIFDRYLPFSCPPDTFVTDAARFSPFHRH
ncbi:hypothetical protein DOE63_16495 [Salmonella enterica subsp. diarizonae serovar 59:z10:-]|nr:hypothetical protein DOE63_16495 [Salmonella enterica subsp. diarizonae serovar 59:z10:-]